MKNIIHTSPTRFLSRPSARLAGKAILLFSALLLSAPNLHALAFVKTISGGPTQANRKYFGSADGISSTHAQYHTPIGLAIDNTGTYLYVADRDNNAIRRLDLSANQTTTFTTQGTAQPVGVALDSVGNVYALLSDGTVLEFDSFGDPIGTLAFGLGAAGGIAIDPGDNVYVTVGESVVRINTFGTIDTVSTVSGAVLQGIAILTDGTIAVTDAAGNGILIIDPNTGDATPLTGFNGAGDHFGSKFNAQFNQPYGIAAASGNILIVADSANNRVKVVNSIGAVTNLYGVASSFWVTGSGRYPGWWDGNVCAGDANYNVKGCVESRLPTGIVIAPDGSLYATEDYYHIIRHITFTGLSNPTSAGPPQITAQPQSQTVNIGGTATFTVSATGAQPITYQWRLNGNPIAGATDSTFTRANAQITDAGTYSVVVGNAAGSITSSNAVLTVNAPPFITTQPQSQEVAPGANATFLVIAGGAGPLSYQWRFNGANISGATASTYTRVNAQASDSGNYSVIITNMAGSVISSNALLTVDTAPIINTQPVGQTVPVGTNVAFTVTAFGSAPLGFQWRLNGANLTDNAHITGTMSSNLVIFNVQVSDAGNYSVLVTNQFGNVVSANAPLVIVAPPTISPNSGYYPMGQNITVQSGLPDVFYTIDGSEPTTNSLRVPIVGSTGIIRWFNSTNDLTALRVKGFVGTNESTTISGQPVGTNTIGVPPGPNSSGTIWGGIGSTIVVPVVANLKSNETVKSYQFRIEITPSGGAPMVTGDFEALKIGTNDFVPLVTASQGSDTATNAIRYTNSTTLGLIVSAIGPAANVSFQRFAAITSLRVPIPPTASQGQTYSVAVSFASATSDGVSSPVFLTPMPAATILVTNVPYTVGDSASLHGAWYNAGTFGDNDLVNADVNNAFYAAAGLRVPYAFSDVFNAMDVFPLDAPGFVGGDQQIRLLDWNRILLRALRLDANNWTRSWSAGGDLVNASTTLTPQSPLKSYRPLVVSPWYKQVLIAGTPVGNLIPGTQVSVPVYVKLADGATVAGLQFRASVTSPNGAPALTQAPQLNRAAAIPSPFLQQSFEPSSTAFGWTVGAFNFQSRSSNFLGWLTFTVPPGAAANQSYKVSFLNADAAPDLNTQYDVETRSPSVVVNAPAAPATICSDDWKLQFFGSLTNPSAADSADPDGDGVANWMEYLAGTDPTDAASKLRFTGTGTQLSGGQKQVVLRWLTAPGKAYEVQWTATPGGTWNILGTVSGDGNVIAYPDSTAGAARYYRLRLLQ